MSFFDAFKGLIHGKIPKYTFLDKFFYFEGKPYLRIQANKNFSIKICGKRFEIKKGDIGGFLPFNKHHPNLDGGFHLPHDDCSWISGNARCSEYGKLRNDSLISGNALVTGTSEISMSYVGGDAVIDGSSNIIMNSEVSNKAKIIDAKCIHSSYIFGNSFIKGNVDLTACCVYGDTKIVDDLPFGELHLSYSRIYGNTFLKVFPTQRPLYGQYGGGIYHSKDIFECSIANIDQYNRAVKNGNISNIGLVDCDCNEISKGFHIIKKIYPHSKRSFYEINI